MTEAEPLRAGSLCSGMLGLDAAVAAVFGTELAWVCDNAPAVRRFLADRLPDVPNHGDLTAVDWTLVEPVAILAAGIPCQGWSHAGKRKGHDDERWLWAAVVRAIVALRPRFVIIENVPGLFRAEWTNDGCTCGAEHYGLPLCPACGRNVAGSPGRSILRSGFSTILATLASLGYCVAGNMLRASDIGAPHGRDRIFIVAVADPDSPIVDQRGFADDGEAAGGRPRADARGSTGAGYPGAADPPDDGPGVDGASVPVDADGQPWAGPGADGRDDAEAADPSGVGRGEGQPEPAGVVGGPDAGPGGAGAAGAAADAERGGSQRRGVARVVGGAAGAAAGAGLQREWAGDAAGDSGHVAAADSGGAGGEGAGDRDGGAGPAGRAGQDSGRCDSGPGGGGDGAAADADGQRPAGAEGRGGRGSQGEHDGRAAEEAVGDGHERPAADTASTRRAGPEDPGTGGGAAGEGDRPEGPGAWGREPQRDGDERAAADALGDRGRRADEPGRGEEGGGAAVWDGEISDERAASGVDWQQYQPAIAQWEAITGRRASHPVRPSKLTKKRLRDCAHATGADGWAAAEMVRRGWWGAQLNPEFVEWMMGLAPGWVTGCPGLSRNEQLSILGNGVVPQQAVEGIAAGLEQIVAALAALEAV